MRSFASALTVLSLSGSALTAPLTAPLSPQIRLVDSAQFTETQQQILRLEQTLVSLSNDIIHADEQSLRVNFDAGNAELTSLAERLPSFDNGCPLSSSIETTLGGDQALFELSRVQRSLSDLILHLQDANTPDATLAAEVCIAQIHFHLLQQSNEPNDLGAPLMRPITTPDHLDGTYITSRIALDALISALSATPYSPASVQEAYEQAHRALASYKLAANPKGGVACQPGSPAPPRSPKDAINRVSIVEKAAETSFGDTQENNGKSFYDFCNIENYMGSVRGFVVAWGV